MISEYPNPGTTGEKKTQTVVLFMVLTEQTNELN